MATISKQEKEEMLRLAASSSLREDNEFINHKPKPFKKMIDKVMKL